MRNRYTQGYLIAIDLDGVLCEGEFWGEGEPEPIQKNIDLITKLYFKGHHIIIYTARKEWWRIKTEAWLKNHQVYYHALVMGNLPADAYFNDKNTDFKDLQKLL